MRSGNNEQPTRKPINNTRMDILHNSTIHRTIYEPRPIRNHNDRTCRFNRSNMVCLQSEQFQIPRQC